MKKRLLKISAITLAAIAIGMAFVWLGLRPPAAPEAARQGGRITNVTLIEPGIGRQVSVTITIENGLVSSIEPTQDGDAGDYTGGFVIPGLIDMHVHQPTSFGGFEEYFSLLYLLHGVTTIRDTGYSYPAVFERRTSIAAGEYPGPRIFTCGTFIDGDPPLRDNAIVVRTADEAQQAVARLAAEGVDCIKVYSNLRADALEAIHRASQEFDLPVIGHIPTQVPFEQARLSDVQHLIGIPDYGPIDGNENLMAAGWEALTDERIEFISQTSLNLGIAHTPTLVFLDYNARRDDPNDLIISSGADYLPSVFPDFFWHPEASLRPGGIADAELYSSLRQAFVRGLETVRELHQRGVKIHAGTDTGNPFIVPGISLHQELELLHRAGLDAEEALAAATSVPGQYLADTGLGRIRVGGPADLLILDGAPTVNLEALATLRLVVADGRFYERATLQRDVDQYKAHFHNVVWDKVVPLIAGLFD